MEGGGETVGWEVNGLSVYPQRAPGSCQFKEALVEQVPQDFLDGVAGAAKKVFKLTGGERLVSLNFWLEKFEDLFFCEGHGMQWATSCCGGLQTVWVMEGSWPLGSPRQSRRSIEGREMESGTTFLPYRVRACHAPVTATKTSPSE